MARKAKERRWRVRLHSESSDCEDSGVQLDDCVAPPEDIDSIIQQLSNPKAHVHKYQDTWAERKNKLYSISPSNSRKSILSTSSERSISPSIDSLKSISPNVSPSCYSKSYSPSRLSPSRASPSKSSSPHAHSNYQKSTYSQRHSSSNYLQYPNTNSKLSPRTRDVRTSNIFKYPTMQTSLNQTSGDSLDDREQEKMLNQRHQKEYKRSLAKDLRKKCNVLLGRGNSSETSTKSVVKQSRKSVDSIEFSKRDYVPVLDSLSSHSVSESKSVITTQRIVVTKEEPSIKENNSPSSTKVIFSFDSGQEDSDDGIAPQLVFPNQRDSSGINKSDKSPSALKRSCSVGHSKSLAPYALRRHCPRQIAERRCNATNKPLRLSSSESSLPKTYSSSPSLDFVRDEAKVRHRHKKTERAGTLDVPCDTDSLTQESVSTNATTPTTRSKFKLPRNVKKKFMFLRRRHTDTSLVDKLEQLEEATKKTDVSSSQLASWRSSFSALLNDPAGLSMFQAFLRSEFSEENINFWIACQDFKNLKAENLRIAAQKIYYEYIAVAAPMEINLDSATRLDTKAMLDTPNVAMFNRAQRRIEALMEKDSYPRFLQSTLLLSIAGRR